MTKKLNSSYGMVGVVVLIALCIGFGSKSLALNYSLKNERQKSASLNKDLTTANDELDVLRTDLSKTEEGKKQLETAKAQAETSANQATANAKALTGKVTAAQQTSQLEQSALSKAQGIINSKNSDIANVNASLTKANNDLATSKAALDKVNQCVDLFSSTRSLMNTYVGFTQDTIKWILQSDQDSSAGNLGSASTAAQLAQSNLNDAQKVFSEIQKNFDTIQSGNCN